MGAIILQPPEPITSVWDKGTSVDWEDETYLDDPLLLDFARRGDMVTTFQFDSPGIRRLLRDISPTSFNDMVAATTLYRPGPMGSGGDKSYVARKNGQEEWASHTPQMIREVCAKTYGLPIYQESIMMLLNKCGRIPLPDCERVRKAISTKKAKIFRKYELQFIRGAQETCSWNEDQARSYWADTIQGWSSYGFNRSHAVAYTIISARGLFLKAHYPLEWYCAALSNLATGSDKIKSYMAEAARHGIKIDPPDVQASKASWSISDAGNLVFPLNQVKGIGVKAESIASNAPYASLDDFLDRSGAGKASIENLIKAGFLAKFSTNREAMLKYFEAWRSARTKMLITPTKIKTALASLGVPKATCREVAECMKPILAAEGIAKWVDQGSDPSKKAKMTTGLPLDAATSWLTQGVVQLPAEQIQVAIQSVIDGSATEEIRKLVEMVGLSRPSPQVAPEIIEEAIASIREAAGAPDLKHLEETSRPWDEAQTLEAEQESLGFSMPFSHPLFTCDRDGERPICMVQETGVVDGLIVDKSERKTKSMKVMHTITLDDGYDRIKVIVWDEIWRSYMDHPVYKEALAKGACVRLKVDPPSNFPSATLRSVIGAIQILKPPPKPRKSAWEERAESIRTSLVAKALSDDDHTDEDDE